MTYEHNWSTPPIEFPHIERRIASSTLYTPVAWPSKLRSCPGDAMVSSHEGHGHGGLGMADVRGPPEIIDGAEFPCACYSGSIMSTPVSVAIPRSASLCHRATIIRANAASSFCPFSFFFRFKRETWLRAKFSPRSRGRDKILLFVIIIIVLNIIEISLRLQRRIIFSTTDSIFSLYFNAYTYMIPVTREILTLIRVMWH